jgi:hypothetical protein
VTTTTITVPSVVTLKTHVILEGLECSLAHAHETQNLLTSQIVAVNYLARHLKILSDLGYTTVYSITNERANWIVPTSNRCRQYLPSVRPDVIVQNVDKKKEPDPFQGLIPMFQSSLPIIDRLAYSC